MFDLIFLIISLIPLALIMWLLVEVIRWFRRH